VALNASELVQQHRERFVVPRWGHREQAAWDAGV